MDSCLSAQLGPPKLYLLHQYPPPLMLYHCNHHSQGTFDRLIYGFRIEKKRKMKLGPSMLAIATAAARDCDLTNYQSKVNFYGCITKRKLSVDYLTILFIFRKFNI